MTAAGIQSRQEGLLRPSDVAAMLCVDHKTVIRWANAGRLTPAKTLGGHRRYYAAEVRALIGQR